MTKEAAAMLDHMGFEVSDYEASKAFYMATLAPLEIELMTEHAGVAAGFGGEIPGVGPKPYFWISARSTPAAGVHVAFTVGRRGLVDAFHAAGLAAGGTDNGAPGLRDYHPHYYGAYVLDPDGNNIEAVCHRPE
jgi:catechol 2,3-dioxygenase-like lactoylglutathione lyase family enzyme